MEHFEKMSDIYVKHAFVNNEQRFQSFIKPIISYYFFAFEFESKFSLKKITKVQAGITMTFCCDGSTCKSYVRLTYSVAY